MSTSPEWHPLGIVLFILFENTWQFHIIMGLILANSKENTRTGCQILVQVGCKKVVLYSLNNAKCQHGMKIRFKEVHGAST